MYRPKISGLAILVMPTRTCIRNNLVLIVILAFALSACGSRETLLRKSGDVPAGVTLAGQWKMVEDIDVVKRQIDRAIAQTNGVDEKAALKRLSNARKRGQRQTPEKVGGLVYVFLKIGESLKITQTQTALYFSIDRSVVAEYVFGEARLIRTGGAEAQRASGWEGEQYVIETLGKDGMKLTERYHLSDDGSHLHQQIILRSKSKQNVINIQTYERISE